MFPRTKDAGQPVADPARAVARGPIQLTHFPPIRRPKRHLPLYLVLLVYTLGMAAAAMTLRQPGCDPLSALPWLACPHEGGGR